MKKVYWRSHNRRIRPCHYTFKDWNKFLKDYGYTKDCFTMMVGDEMLVSFSGVVYRYFLVDE